MDFPRLLGGIDHFSQQARSGIEHVALRDSLLIAFDADRGNDLKDVDLRSESCRAFDLEAIAKAAHANGTTLREEALRLGYVSAKDFDRLGRVSQL